MRHALIIDDMEIRHTGFRRCFADSDFKLHHARSSAEAIATLQAFRFPHFQIIEDATHPAGRRIVEPEPTDFDMVFFDHDCDEGVDAGKTFMPVIHFIVANPHIFRNQPQIYIHSMNTSGAQETMKRELASVGFESTIKAFGDILKAFGVTNA